MKKKSYTKLAFALSICLLVAWGILGTGTSLAWFTDTTPELKNIFHFGEFDLVVSYKTETGEYKEIDAATAIFDDEALYEPGYVQVVYLKVENKGNVDFDYTAAVSVTDYTPATNAFGQTFHLQDYLRFGMVIADTEAELEKQLESREQALENAQMPLNMYSTERALLKEGGVKYMALIVCMPEEVGNTANYRGNVVPRVELGVIVKATQTNAPMDEDAGWR